MIFGPEQRSAIVGPDPLVIRQDDGTLVIDWHTSDGEPPTLPILVAPELLRVLVDQYNENVA